MSVLLTYATSKGSTAEIAERIASRLRDASITVNCAPTEKVDAKSVSGASAVIVGSAIHMGSWLGPARRLLDTNATTLKTKPTWAFSVGMPPSEEDRKKEAELVEGKIRKVLPELRGHQLFQGRFNKQDLPWVLRIFLCCIPASKQKWGDARDWEQITSWADKVAQEIKQIPPENV